MNKGNQLEQAAIGPLVGAYALSIRAPWPSWIMGTGPDRKCWENRVWRPALRPRYRGPILVHLSKWWDTESVCETIEEVGLEWRTRYRCDMSVAIPPTLSTPRQLHELRGHLLGWVDLVDVRPARDLQGSFWVDAGGASPEHHCCLQLENPRLLDEPVPYRGQLGLFRVQDRAAA